MENSIKNENRKIKIGIIGAGAAGLSAALLAGRNGLETKIFDSKTGGGRVGGIPYIESYPGLSTDRLKGSEFIKNLKAQVQCFDTVTFHELETVTEIAQDEGHFIVTTKKEIYKFDELILAMGVEHKRLNVIGESEFSGRGVSYCAACDGLFFRNKDTVVIGNDTHAVEQAIFLNELQANVTLINPQSTWDAEPKMVQDLQARPITVLENINVHEIFGERLVGGVRFTGMVVSGQNKQPREVDAKGVFISMGFEPRIELVKTLNLEFDANNYIKVDRNQRTKQRGLYAVGDLTGPGLEVVAVCASGANAIKAILNDDK